MTRSFLHSTPVIDMQAAKPLFDYPKYWAECFGPAPFLPMSREEMDQLGWDSCDIIIVTGDAYVDHPSFGMAVIGLAFAALAFRPAAAQDASALYVRSLAATCAACHNAVPRSIRSHCRNWSHWPTPLRIT